MLAATASTAPERGIAGPLPHLSRVRSRRRPGAAVGAYRNDGVWAYRQVGAFLQYAECGAGIGVPRQPAEGVITVLVVNVILGVAVLVFLIYRQLSVRPVNASALRLIAVLLVIGLLQTYRFLSQNHAHPLTFAALGGSLVLAAIFGALRARTVRVWLDDGQAWSQGNWLTAVLWIASLAAHLGYDILVGHGNGIRGLGVATIVLYLAISLGFQRVLVMQRAHRLQLAGPAAVAEPGGTG